MKRILWSYWEGPLSEMVTLSHSSWRKHLPGWDIRLLNKATAAKYLLDAPQQFEILTSTQQSDVIRLTVLYKHGGCWIDASVVLHRDLDWVSDFEKLPMFGFRLPNKPYIESWFLVAPQAKSGMIGMWLDTLGSIIDTRPTFKNHPAYAAPCTKNGEYFMVYEAFCYLLRTSTEFRRDVDLIPNISASPHMCGWFRPALGVLMTKYTRHDRRFRFMHFPLPYVYMYYVVLAIGILVVLVYA